MKHLLSIIIFSLFILSCKQENETIPAYFRNWDKNTVDHALSESLESGSTYLSVYSQIYNRSEHRTYDLTVTISMRNTGRTDTLFIEKADYYDTGGRLVRSYLNKSIYLAPMETVEIVINEEDNEGGTGANLVFDWKITPGSNEPFFEGVMISTYGQQGLSFTTQGIRIQ